MGNFFFLQQTEIKIQEWNITVVCVCVATKLTLNWNISDILYNFLIEIP